MIDFSSGKFELMAQICSWEKGRISFGFKGKKKGA
jgi:hypothetical protein